MIFCRSYKLKFSAGPMSLARPALKFALVLLACALPGALPAQTQQQVVQQFFVPFPEVDFQNSLKAIDTTGTPVGTDLNSIISIAVGTTNTVIIYDQWEDGYENDINNPIQASTQIWGDGNTNNGVAPGFPNDLLPPGSVIVLTNIVSLPRNPSVLKYDGRDRIAATKAVTVTRATWAINPGTVLMSGTEVYDTTRWGTFFEIPVGTNVGPATQNFSYASLHIIASQNGTTVQVDTNGDGIIDRSTTLNIGDSYFVNGGISAGATVTASKPVQVHELTGRIGSTYQSRTFAIRPFSQWDTSYYAPVGTILASEIHDVFVYNPYTTNLTVLYATKVGTGAISVPPNNDYRFAMPLNSGAHFYTTNGVPFYAVGANDAGGTNTVNNTHDWGYALLPEAALTPLIVVGWAPGSDDIAAPAGPDANGSPVWITPTKPTTIYVNYSGNYTAGPNIAPNGQHYDTAYSLAAYQFQTVYNPTTKNMTGARIFTTDGTTFAAAWGEDSSKAGCCSPYFDAGNTIIPFPVPKILKTSKLVGDANGDGLAGWGDTLEYTVHVQNEGMLALGNVLVLDGLPGTISYVPNTTIVNGTPVADNMVPPAATAFPLDENGLLLPQILVGGFSDIKFRVTINPGTIGITNTVSAEGAGDPVSSTEAVPVIASTNQTPTVTVVFTDASGTPVSSYLINSGIYVKLTDSAQNTSTNTIQTITATVTNLSNGDVESMSLTETGVNTGVFRNTTALPSSTSSGAGAGNGTLLALGGNDLLVSYTDPLTANSGSAHATVTSAPLPAVTKRSQLITDLNGDGRIGWGDTVEYTITVTNGSALTITNPVVKDTLPANVSYVTGSTTTNAVAIADSGTTPFPLDESGFQLGSIAANSAAIVKFRVTVSSGTSISNSVVVTNTNGFVQAQDVAVVLPPPPSCNLSFSDAAGNALNSYAQNSGIYVTLTDVSLNTDSTTAQTVTLLVQNTSNSDVEFVTLTETGTNTGVFRNASALPASTISGSSTQDGTLYAQPGQNLQVDYKGASSEACSATATIARNIEIKKLYLSDPNQALDRIDPFATNDGSTTNTATLGSAGGSTATIAFDAAASAQTNAATLTFAHTNSGGSNRLVLVGISTDNTTVTSVTYGGVSLTNVGSATASGSPKPRSEIWSLPNPPAGSNNVVVILATSANIAAGAASFTGVSQTTPLGAFTGSSASSGSASISVSSATGELVFDSISSGNTPTVGASQTQRWNLLQGTIAGGASTQPGAASVTMAWTVGGKWAIGVVPIKPASTGGGGGGTNSTLFTQTPAMCKSFTMPAGQVLAVTNYVQATTGFLPANPNVTAVLFYGTNKFATLTSPVFNSGVGTLGWTATLTTNVTVPANQAITLWVTNNETTVNFNIQYDSAAKPSAISLPTTTVINIDALNLYDAPYPAGNLLGSAFNGQTVYVRASVSDPFGSYDVNKLNLSIMDPGSNFLNVTLTNNSAVADDGCVKTYEYAWVADSYQGLHTIQATAFEGTEGITNSAGTSIQVAFPDGGTPSTTKFIDAGGNPTNNYNAGQTVCVRVTDANMNQNPGVAETVTVLVTTSSGDSEPLTLLETGTNSGVFTGCISANTTASIQNNGLLNAPAGAGLTVTYTDPTNPLDSTSDTAIVRTVVSANPVISLFKTLVDPANGNVLLGSTVQFNILIANPGSVTVTNVKVTDTFPSARLQFTSASLSPDSNTPPGTLTWTNIGPLAPGQSVTINTFFNALNAGAITNSVSVSGTTNVGPVLSFATNISPALSVTKTLVSPVSGPAFINDTVVYRIAIINIGNTIVTNWPLSDQFSASCFQFLGASVTPSGAGGGTLLWTGFPPLAAGAGTNIYVTNKVTGSCSPALNSADISYGVDQFGNGVPPVLSTASITNIGANISGNIWYDANANGTNDAGDTALYNVIAFVDLNGDGVRQPTEPFTFSATNGQYQITSLAASNYVVRVDTNTLPAGVRPTYDLDGTNTPNAFSLTLTNGQSITNGDLGYIGSGSISGYLWNDVNVDGVKQAGEPILAGVKVFIDLNGNGVREADEPFVLTGADGSYLISNLVSNTYQITVDLATLPTGVHPTFDTDGTITPDVVSVVLGGGQNSTDIDFGFQGSASLSGLVTDIFTGQPIADATVSVVDSLGVVQTTASGVGGIYNISSLWIGAATVTVNKTGYVTTNSNPVIVNGANTVNEQLTPNTVTGSVADAITAQPVAGATVQVIDNAGITNTVTTDGSGHYGVTNVSAGPATMTASKTGYSPAAATPTFVAGNNTQNFTLTANTLSGQVTDAFTGQQISGATVRVVDAVNVTNTVITDATGHYGVTNIAAGLASIAASKSGYVTGTVTPVISAGNNTQNLILTPNTLGGLVTDAVSSQPIVGATVNVVDAAGVTNSLVTDAGGHFGVTNIAVGVATVTAAKAGYSPTNAGPTIVSGSNTLNVQLTLIPQADVATTGAGPASVSSGAAILYTITVTNMGPATASNTVVSDVLPVTGTFVGASAGGTNNSGVVTWPVIVSLASGGTTNFTITCTAPVGGTLTNVASSVAATGDPDLTNNNGSAASAKVITTVASQADIAVFKTGAATVLAGGNLTYTLTVTNLGPSTGSNIVVIDNLPGAVTFVSASGGGANTSGIVSWPTITTLANGAATNFTVTVKAPASGSFTNTASATSSTGDPVPSNNDGSGAGSAVLTTVTQLADIAVLKSGSSTVLAGGNLTYTITVTNLGPSTASNVVVSDALPLSVGFVSVSGGGTNASGLVTWPAITSLANGGTTNYTVTVKAPASGSFTNTASATSSTLDPVSSNNDGSSTGSAVSTTVTPQADIAVLKTGSSTVLAGGNLTYTITVTNLGPSTASNIVVSDTLPLSVTFVSASGGGTNNGGLATWPSIPSLANAAATSFTVTVKAPASGSFTNTASATSSTPDPVTSNNDGSGAGSAVGTTVTPQADIAVIKTGSSTVLAGGNLTYTIMVTNLGPSTASNVVVSDNLPGAVSFVSASGGGTNNSGTVTWPAVTSLANGGTTNFTVTVKAPAGGSFTNTASATSSTGDPVLSNNDGSGTSSAVSTTVTPQADIAVIKTGASTVLAGGNLTYTITVTNLGPSTANNVVVSDALPLSVAFVSASGGGTNNSGLVTWPAISSLLNGGTTSFTITVKAPASGSFTNTASASSSTPDPAPSNNDGTGASSAVSTTVTPQADIAVIKTGPSTVLAGGNLTYTITVTNLGPSTGSNIVVSDNLPSPVNFISASGGGANASGIVTWPVFGSLANGGTTNFTVTVKAPASGSFTNTASATSSTGDPVPSNNDGSGAGSAVLTTVTPQADLAVIKTGATTVLAGGSLTYTITVTNLGPSTASNIVVSDNLPGAVTFVSASDGGTNAGSVVTWPSITSLANGGMTNFTVTVKAPASGFFTNTASATSSTPDPVSSNNDGTGSSSAVSTMVTPQADVAVIKTGSSTVLAGGKLTYTITVTNLGPSTASNVVVSDNLPSAVTFVNASGAGTNNSGIVTWPAIPSLLNGSTTNFTVTVKAPASGSFTNFASASSVTPDPVAPNNDGTGAGSAVSTTVTPQADIAVIKTGASTVLAGGNLTYTITVTNLGPSTASNVIVSDTLPLSVTFVSASGGGTNNSGLVTWPTITSLANGATTNFTVTVKAPASGSFTNTAAATSSTADPVPFNNDGSSANSTVSTTVTPQADIAVLKTGPATVLAGGNLTYTITVTNLGPSTASNLVVSDTLPLSVTFVSTSGGGTNNSGVVNWPVIASLVNGAATSFTVTVKAPASGSFTNTASATSSTLDPVSSNNDGSGTGSAVSTTVTPQADVAVLKTGSSTVLAGGNLTYTITVTNLGPSTASNVMVGDTLPLSVTFVSASGGGTNNGGLVTWPSIPALANAVATSFTVTVKAPASGSFTNTASAISSTPDPVPSNNDGSAAGSSVSTAVTPQADIAVLKTGPATVLAGGNLTYTITVTNLGPSTASNLVVSDTLPLSVTFVGANAGGTNNSGIVTWPTITSMANGGTTNFTVTVKAPVGGSFTNTALASSTTPDPFPSNNDGTSAGSAVSTTVTPQADVAVIKTGASTVLAGGNLTYTITVTNLGPSTASNVIVSDTLPLSVAIVGASGGGTNASGLVTWPTIISLVNGGATNFTVTVKAPVSGSFTNTASATSSTGDPVPSNNDGSGAGSAVTTTVTPQADIAVLKTGPANVLAGGNLTYTITVTNLGPSPASNIVVSDNLPGAVTFVGASGGGTNNSGVINWPSITSLLNGGTTNFTVTVKAPTSGSFTNTATATSSTPDPVASNNDGTGAGSAVSTTVTPQADIAVIKTGASTVLAGGNLIYTITVTNFGPSTASNVVISDTLPLSVAFVSASGGGTNNSGLVTWPVIASLANGAATSFTVTVKAPASGSFTNTASAASSTGDPVPANNDGSGASSAVSTTVTPQADIAVLKTGSSTLLAGGNLTYTITVTNLGPSTASNVVVSDNLPGAVTFVSASGGGTNASGSVTWPVIASLVNGGATNFTVTVKAPASGSFTNTALASSTTLDPVPSNNDGSAASSAVTTTVTPQADIAVLKTGSSTVLAGGNLTYTITVTNLGPSTASNIVVSDNLPGAVAFVSASGGGTNASSSVTWPVIASLVNGGATNFTVTVKAPAGGSFTNRASAISSTGDPVPSNNDGTGAGSTVSTTVTPQADIAVIKTGASTVLAGANLTYTIIVTNLGPSTASNVVISDTLPLSVTFVSANGGGINNSGIVTWPAITSLANGGTTNFTVTVKAPAGGSFTNTASATSSTADPVPSNNDGSGAGSAVSTTVTPQADIAVLKSGSSAVLAGGNLTYTITVTNLGPSTASNIVVSDSLPGAVNFVGASNSGTNNSGVVTWPVIASLANGATTSFTVTVKAPASGAFTNTASAITSTGDPVPSNNDGSGAGSAVSTTVTPQADIAVIKTGSATVLAGGNLTYTITVTNLGPSTASNIVVSDNLPGTVTFVSASGGGTNAGGLVMWPSITSLANGGTANFMVTVKAPASGSFTNRASATSSTPDPVSSNNDGTGAGSAVSTSVTPQADVAVLKTGPATVLAGGNLTYTITVTNLGPSTASNVVVSDTLPLSVTFASASGGGLNSSGIVTWPVIGSLANGAATSFTVTVKAPASGSFTNRASATSSTGDPVSSNNDGSGAGSAVGTTVTPLADIVVLKTGPATALAGGTLTYTITVTNLGPSTASNVLVADGLPLNATFVSANGGGINSNGIVTWPVINSLLNGAATNFTVTLKAPASGSLTNRAYASASTGDPNMSNNDGTAAGSQVATTVGAGQFGILAGTNVFNPQMGLYEERVTITNASVSTAAALRLYVGGLRAGVQLYNATGTNAGRPFVQYNAPLDPGQTVVLLLEFAVPDRRPFTNTLEVEAVLPASSNPTSGSGPAITRSFVDARIAGDLRFVIEFATVPGRIYTVIYSDDNLQTWKTATPSVTANANVTQWYDDGPPKTDSKPITGGNRFYRVIVAPSNP
jgi:uncharacterized repeat protein (TIGR01451 family)